MQRHGFLQARHGKSVGLGGEDAGRFHGAVAIGVGLDDRHELGPGRLGAGIADVVQEVAEMDSAAGRARDGHGKRAFKCRGTGITSPIHYRVAYFN